MLGDYATNLKKKITSTNSSKIPFKALRGWVQILESKVLNFSTMLMPFSPLSPMPVRSVHTCSRSHFPFPSLRFPKIRCWSVIQKECADKQPILGADSTGNTELVQSLKTGHGFGETPQKTDCHSQLGSCTPKHLEPHALFSAVGPFLGIKRGLAGDCGRSSSFQPSPTTKVHPSLVALLRFV